MSILATLCSPPLLSRGTFFAMKTEKLFAKEDVYMCYYKVINHYVTVYITGLVITISMHSLVYILFLFTPNLSSIISDVQFSVGNGQNF